MTSCRTASAAYTGGVSLFPKASEARPPMTAETTAFASATSAGGSPEVIGEPVGDERPVFVRDVVTDVVALRVEDPRRRAARALHDAAGVLGRGERVARPVHDEDRPVHLLDDPVERRGGHERARFGDGPHTPEVEEARAVHRVLQVAVALVE